MSNCAMTRGAFDCCHDELMKLDVFRSLESLRWNVEFDFARDEELMELWWRIRLGTGHSFWLFKYQQVTHQASTFIYFRFPLFSWVPVFSLFCDISQDKVFVTWCTHAIRPLFYPHFFFNSLLYFNNFHIIESSFQLPFSRHCYYILPRKGYVLSLYCKIACSMWE
jgi:hypothetical protein